MSFDSLVHRAVQVVEIVGVGILVVGVLAVLVAGPVRAARGTPIGEAYGGTRALLGRVLLLGIEVLVAGDIVRTVAIELTLTAVAELAGIVVIRTFLSWSIEMETEGSWPWQRDAGSSGADA